jgi:CheY-like chemotaxis protein
MAESQSPCVLVVEDNPLNMRLAVDLLTLNNLRVLEAESGEAALELIRRERPDLILLDIRLPGMDGFEVCRRLRDDPRLAAVRIVAMTASVMREEAQRILDDGFDDYIQKPIDTRAFVQKVRALLASPRGAGSPGP